MSALAFNNSTVRELRRLIGRRSSRHEARRFVVEGPVLVAEAVSAGWTIESQFVPEGSDAWVGDRTDGLWGDTFELSVGVFERVASTQTPQPPIAVVRMRDVEVAPALETAAFVVLLDGISDPGNLGTIIRSAEAAGVDLIVLTPGSVDPYSPKVVRSSAGAIFHVPVVVAEIDDVSAAGILLVGTSSHDAPGRHVVAHTACDLTGRIALVMGNEAAGLPAEWNDRDGPIDRWVMIPHRGRSESLNVAMATTVLAFEAARQRDQSRENGG